MELLMKKSRESTEHDVDDKLPSFIADPNLELIMFGGKGGVGKTTSAAASAMHIADTFPGKNILLASIDPAHSLHDILFDFEGFDNLSILEINAEASLKEFKRKHQETLRTIARRGTFLDDEDISGFLSLSMPGLDEVMGIIDIIKFLKSPRYDMVVLDTAPTGHMLRLLELPEIMQKWLKALDSMLAKHRYMKMLYAGNYKKDEVDRFLEGMSKDIKKLVRLMWDKTKCEFVPVMIPETLSIQETVRLLTFIERHGISAQNIIINRVYEYSACPLCRSQHLFQANLLEEIQYIFPEYSLIKIPLFRKEIRGMHALNEYGKKLESIWKDAGDTVKGYGSRVACYELNSQPVTCNSQRHQPSGIRKQPLSSSVFNHARIILVGGKGGVGKTTLSCSIALKIRSNNLAKRVLLVSTDPAHSLSDCFDMSIGDKIKDLYKNMHLLEINAQKEFDYMKHLYNDDIRNMFASLLGDSMIDLGYERDVMERLLDLSPPGLDEVMALTRIIDYLEEDVDAKQAGGYDVIIMDTAPTGHLIRFLELPDLINEWLRAFFGIFLKYGNALRVPRFKDFLVKMSKGIKKLRKILIDPEKTVFLPVSIPTEMALEETKDLTRIIGKLHFCYPAIFLNMVIPKSKCNVCSDIRENQKRIINNYYKLFTREKVHIVFHRDREPRGLAELEDLGSEIIC